MAESPLRRQQALKQKERKERQTPYQLLYGLRENPFPTLALFSPSIVDPRRDGRIYDESFRQEEEKAFLKLFVSPQAGDRPLELGFVRVDPSAGGRGNGKSVFLHHIAERINNQDWEDDWGLEDGDPALFSLAVHILPEPRKQRRFWQLIYLLFETLAGSNLFAAIDANFRAALLYHLLSGDQTEELLGREEEAINKSLSSNNLFFDLLGEFDLSRVAFTEEAERQIQTVAASALNSRFMSDFKLVDFSLFDLWGKWRDQGFAPNDYQWRKYGIELFTSGLVPTMIVAGYSRLFVLLDEFEKIYIYQSNRERDEFLDSLRQYFYERDSAIVRNRFVTTVLTIHPSIYGYLRGNWQRVGLDNLAPLDTKRMSSCSVELGASTMPKLERLLITYIDYFRIEGNGNYGTLYPFSEGALEPAIEAARFYPRGALWYAHMILRKAATEGISPPISRDFVEGFVSEGEKPPVEDEDALFQLPVSSNDT
jgi:hypothetical protein